MSDVWPHGAMTLGHDLRRLQLLNHLKLSKHFFLKKGVDRFKRNVLL